MSTLMESSTSKQSRQGPRAARTPHSSTVSTAAHSMCGHSPHTGSNTLSAAAQPAHGRLQQAALQLQLLLLLLALAAKVTPGCVLQWVHMAAPLAAAPAAPPGLGARVVLPAAAHRQGCPLLRHHHGTRMASGHCQRLQQQQRRLRQQWLAAGAALQGSVWRCMRACA
jgi:hypothetical protein